MTTWALEASAVSALVVLVGILTARGALSERAAGRGTAGGPGWSRPPVVRRLDVAAVLLTLAATGLLVAIVVAGAPTLF